MKHFLLTTSLCRQVPESPIWLISQGRTKDAEASLCWLRGWVDKSAVQSELEDLVKYHETVTKKSAQKLGKDMTKNYTPLGTQKLLNCKQNPELTSVLPCTDVKLLNNQHETNEISDDDGHLLSDKDNTPIIGNKLRTGMVTVVSHDESELIALAKEELMIEEGLSPQFVTVGGHNGDSRVSKLKEMIRLLLKRETLRPLFLTISFFSFYAFGGIPSLRPFLVEVFESLHSPIESSWSTVSPFFFRSRYHYTFPNGEDWQVICTGI
jgi:hypothetical protein